MNTISNQLAGIRNTLNLLSKALKSDISHIRIQTDSDTNSTVSFYSNSEIQSSEPLNREDHLAIVSYLKKRSFLWSSPEDGFSGRNSSPTLKILLAPLSGLTCMGDIEFAKSATVPEINISNITKESITPLSDVIIMEKALRDALTQALKQRSGMILTNHFESQKKIGGSALVLSMRPDALFFDTELSSSELLECISASKNHLVVIGVPSLNPVEQIWNICTVLKDSGASTDSFTEQLLLSFVNTRVRRQCGVCAKSTNIPADSVNKLPQIIQNSIEKTYMFSRGCSKCGFSSYRGMLDLSTAIPVDEGARTYINHGASESLVLHSFKQGMRSLMEDGISKVYQGLTSFEEIISECPPIPDGYIEAHKRMNEIKSNVSQQKPVPGSINMLIVEDDCNQREVLQMVFSSEGYAVTLAENGKAALETLETSSFDIILSDVMMPIMSGIDMVRELKSNAKTKSIPVLMLTAVSSSEDEYEVLSYGADDYCDKNVKKKILIKRVERLLKDKLTTNQNPLSHLL